MLNNGDTKREYKVAGKSVRGLGSFHKTLKHNEFGEVDSGQFEKLVDATEGAAAFKDVPSFASGAAKLTNPQGGLASDRLTQHPAHYTMPPAPQVLSITTAAEMTELYWMALLRDVSFDQFADDPGVKSAAAEVYAKFQLAVADTDAGHLMPGIDVPDESGKLAKITPQNLFRLGLPGDEFGPMLSQFMIRDIHYGTQQIDQKQLPYAKDRNYLTEFTAWLDAQNTGRDIDGNDYSTANDGNPDNFEKDRRYIATPRDLARFVNKDALHQAYFNATLLLLSGGALWTDGNPYGDNGSLNKREAGFGVLGGPHILALVSEVATRALKVVWNQKWQVHLRLRPEAYGGLVHVQNIGAPSGKRPYGLPGWVASTAAAKQVKDKYKSLLLPMAFTPGSPNHPAYGAGHATVAGACVTVLKAFFKTINKTKSKSEPIKFSTLTERETPYSKPQPIQSYITSAEHECVRKTLPKAEADKLTIEGELNKLAMNVAMGRSFGGVHWRTDNTRSLILGEALAARILADITLDSNEKPTFEFRSFSRKSDGKPKMILIRQGRIYVDGDLVETNTSAL